MNRNIEIKAKLPDRQKIETLVQAMADEGPIVLEQEDVFFHSRSGRLKLRTINQQQSELIYYEGDENAAPNPPNYIVIPVADPAAMRSILAESTGEKGVIRKRRTLYLIGPTRVHLD